MFPRLISLLVLAMLTLQGAAPIRLHPENPHYFEWRGKPTVLITSGEHYGAALNRDFDYIPYLDELHKHSFNLTRVFSGTYREIPGSFNITDNTLAPASDKFLCPWARAGNDKFDLTKWDDAYFSRLKDLLTEAARRGIVIELVLFCTMYDDALWHASPMNARNNINDVADVSRGEVYSGANQKLTAVQADLARKFANELNGFDNLYFEICNEPYERGGLTKSWNDRIAAAIAEAESALPNKHLIAQGFPPTDEPIQDLNPRIAILNFHAATEKSVRLNYQHNCVLAFDETGGSDRSDRKYRSEGWDFIITGGAVYDHLDFSFTTSRPNGSFFPLPGNTPGGGGPQLRQQLAVLKRFIESLEFVHMKPSDNLLKSPPAKNQSIRILANHGKSYAVYIQGGSTAKIDLEIPPGDYFGEWINTKTGAIERTVTVSAKAPVTTLESPSFSEDVALRLNAAALP
jgi:hypothetical protein